MQEGIKGIEDGRKKGKGNRLRGRGLKDAEKNEEKAGG
jgi:hypothetical protein